MQGYLKLKIKRIGFIYMTKERWGHINVEHSDIAIEEIKRTIINPIKITEERKNVSNYYSYFKNKRSKSKYLKVIVKYLNGEGYVITSYFIKYIK